MGYYVYEGKKFLRPHWLIMIKHKIAKKEESEDNKQPVRKLENSAKISVKISAWPSSVQNKTDINVKLSNKIANKIANKIGYLLSSFSSFLRGFMSYHGYSERVHPISVFSVLCFVLRFGILYFYQYILHWGCSGGGHDLNICIMFLIFHWLFIVLVFFLSSRFSVLLYVKVVASSLIPHFLRWSFKYF